MARLPRFVLPGYPQHVIQRGNNHQRILFEEEDYWFLWEKIGAAANKFECDLHAYVLMPIISTSCSRRDWKTGLVS
jgi:putative transposase